MSAAELAEVMRGLGRLEGRLDALEQAVHEVPEKSRVDLERLIDGILARARAAAEEKEQGNDLAVQRARRARK